MCHYHSYYCVVRVFCVEGHALHARACTSHHADVRLVEAYGASVAVGQDELVRTVGEHYVNHLVVLHDVDGAHALRTWTRVVGQAGTLYGTVLCGEDDVVRVEELGVRELLALYAEEGVDGVARLELEHILYGTSLGVLCALRYLEALEPVHASHLGEEENHVVCLGGVDELREVLFACAAAAASRASARLSAEVGLQGALDVSEVAHGDYDGVVGEVVLGVELGAGELYLRAAWVAVPLLHLEQVVLHHLLAQLGVVEDRLEVFDSLHELVELVVQLLLLQTRQLAQAHVHDILCLHLVEAEALHESLLGLRWRLGGLDDLHHLVDVVRSHDESLQQVCALLSLAQVELRAADGDVVAVLHEVLHALLQREQAWATVYQGDAVY